MNLELLLYRYFTEGNTSATPALTQFSKKFLEYHYLKRLNQFKFATIGYYKNLINFLDVGESLESAIYYFVLHKKGPKIPPEDFIFSLYFIELNKEKNVPFYKHLSFNNNSFYFTLLHLIKIINYKLSYKSDTPKTKRFIPHDTMMRILKEQLGELYDVG
jgi:hypothetical protein